MIVKYYKGYISLEELETKLKTNRDGTNAFQMIEVLNELGFKSEGIKTPHNILSIIQIPCIAHVVIDKKYNHYIVIYKIDSKREKIIIADPSSSIKKISFKEFFEIWDDILITMYPIKPIVYKRNIKLKDYIKSQLIKYKKEIIYIMFMSLLYMIFTVVTSFSFKFLFEFINESNKTLFLVLTFFIIFDILKNITNFLRSHLLIFINQKIDIDMNMEIYSKVINLPYQYYSNRTTGEIISKITDLSKVRELISNLLLIVLFDLPLTIISGIILFIISSKLFIISFFVLLIYIVIYIIASKKIYFKTNNCLESKASSESFLFESINSYNTVKGLKIENKMISNYDHKYSFFLSKIVNLDKYINRQSFYKSSIDSISQLLILGYAISLVSKKLLSLGNLLAYNSVSVFFYSPIQNILSLNLSIEQAKNAFKRAYEIVVEEENRGFNINKINNIDIKNLYYSYNEQFILKNINISIKRGEKIIITGNSGSGKTTLLKLLMKYYKTNYGMIRINNMDINDIKDTRNCIAFVSQNESLFTDSIYNNINIYNVDIDSVSKVIDICYINEIIKNNNLGLNMLIEENGFNISGGQKQRIILARSLLSDFDILLVDEGLNQVDISLERKILKQVFELYKDKTMIFISHRLENLDLYDRMIKLNNGKAEVDVTKC